eukprot:8314844-Ditylum_brightwellii.AAC.1
MTCHSLTIAITVAIAEQMRSRAVILVHISGSMCAWLVFLIAAFNIESLVGMSALRFPEILDFGDFLSLVLSALGSHDSIR